MPAFKEKDQSLGASRTAPGVRPLSDPCRQRLRAGCWCRFFCDSWRGLVAAGSSRLRASGCGGEGGGGGFAQRPYIGGTFACARACARSCACTCACKWDEACVGRGVGADIDSGSGFVPWATRAGNWACSRSASRWMCSAVCVGFRDGACGDWRVGKTRSRERAIVFKLSILGNN